MPAPRLAMPPVTRIPIRSTPLLYVTTRLPPSSLLTLPFAIVKFVSCTEDPPAIRNTRES